MNRKIAVIGLGYVGLPMVVEFGLKHAVVAFDINQKRIAELKDGIDRSFAVECTKLSAAKLLLTSHPADLKKADFYIVAVPTPINQAKQPDMSYVYSASEIVGRALKKGDIVVYESTVYPGATEDECAPLLEKYSGLKCGKDFFLGYSPERINPGDKEHHFCNIRKVVSGQNPAVLDIIATVYASVVTAGVYKAASIKVAEAAKVIENTQRDLNIALINELAIIFEKLEIDTADVLATAGTKWNFLPFKPGLVGGHCIGVDPYYLTYKAHMLGVTPEVILAGRRINDDMGQYVARKTIKQMARLGKPIHGAKIAILGLTFKENCNDIRNTRVIDIVHELRGYSAAVIVHDPLADPEEVKHEYGIDLVGWDEIVGVDAMILAVAHEEYLHMPITNFAERLNDPKLIIDVKNVFDREDLQRLGVNVWRL